MKKEEFDALREDIRKNGLREKIALLDGRIIDGRNRYEACKALNIKPAFIKLPRMTTKEAASFSLSHNLMRRHLMKSQRAMLLVKCGIVAHDESAGARRVYRTGTAAIREISRSYGISHVCIYKALFVWTHDRELANSVLKGRMSVTRAERQLRREAAERSARKSDAINQLSGVFNDIRRVQGEIRKVPAKFNFPHLSAVQDYLDKAVHELKSQLRLTPAHHDHSAAS